MNTGRKSRLSQFWPDLQDDPFPFLREEDPLALTPALEGLICTLEFIELDASSHSAGTAIKLISGGVIIYFLCLIISQSYMVH